jgi:hypothetical protein
LFSLFLKLRRSTRAAFLNGKAALNAAFCIQPR